MVPDWQGQAGHPDRTAVGGGLGNGADRPADRELGLRRGLPYRCRPRRASRFRRCAVGSDLHDRGIDDHRSLGRVVHQCRRRGCLGGLSLCRGRGPGGCRGRKGKRRHPRLGKPGSENGALGGGRRDPGGCRVQPDDRSDGAGPSRRPDPRRRRDFRRHVRDR